jgi:hypothetical protein
MAILGKVLRGFAVVWMTVVAILMTIGYLHIFWHDGCSALRDALPSPWNISGFVVSVISISPALGAWWLADALTNQRPGVLPATEGHKSGGSAGHLTPI